MPQATVDIVLSNGQKAGQTLKELGKDANRLNKEIRDLQPGTEAFIKKSQDLQKVTARIKDVKGQINGVTAASGEMLQSFLGLTPIGGAVNNIKNGFESLRGGVGGVTKGFGILKGAIISSGIGALVLIIMSLVQMFRASEEGQNKWNKLMAIGSAIMGKMTDILVDLGDIIWKTFSDPQKAVSDLWQSIKQNLINRLTGFIDMWKFAGKVIWSVLKFDWDAVKENSLKFGESVTQMVTGVDDFIGKVREGIKNTSAAIRQLALDTAAAAKAAGLIADLEAKTNKMERELIVERAAIERAVNELRLKASQEQEFSAEQRLEFIRQASALEDELLAKELAVAQNRLAILQQKANLSKNDTKEELDAIAQAQALVESLVAKRMAGAKELQGEELKIQKEDQRNKAEARKVEEDALRDIAQLKIDLMEDGLEKEIEKIWESTEQKIAALTGSEEQITQQKLLLEELRMQQIQAVQDKYDKIESDKKAEKQKQDQENLDKSLKGTADFFGSASALFGEHTVAYKAFTALQIQFDTIQAAIAAYKSTAEIPLVGPFLAPIAAAAAAIFGEMKLSQLNSKSVPRFSMGGLLRGPKHSRGGIPGVIRGGWPIEMEGDEIILTGNVSRSPAGRAAASALNYRYGGIRFATGGPVNPLQPVSSSSMSPAAGTFDTMGMSEIKNLLLETNYILRSWPTRLQVHNNVQDTRKGIKVLNDLENRANF